MKIIPVADFVYLVSKGRLEAGEELLVINKKIKKIVALIEIKEIPKELKIEEIYKA